MCRRERCGTGLRVARAGRDGPKGHVLALYQGWGCIVIFSVWSRCVDGLPGGSLRVVAAMLVVLLLLGQIFGVARGIDVAWAICWVRL